MGLRKGRVSLVGRSPLLPHLDGVYIAILVTLMIGTLWGLIMSGARRDWNWFAGILFAWLVGLGGVVGWIYVFRTKREARG